MLDSSFFTDTLLIWPLADGGYEYGVLLYEEGQSAQIYVDRHGKALNQADGEIIAQHKENISDLLEKARRLWGLEQPELLRKGW